MRATILVYLFVICAVQLLYGQILQPITGGAVTQSTSACTPAPGYAHCRSLTVNANQVGGSTLTNFPVLVSATLGASRVQNASCYDVIFTSDSEGTSLIPWEQEACAQSGGTIVDWVLLASISASSNTSFYVSYGDAAVSTAQNTGNNGPTHVWDAAYKGVWHLPNGTVLTAADSTSNNNSGTLVNSPAATVGYIDGAASFATSGSEAIHMTNTIATSSVTAYTISAWIKPSNPVTGSYTVPFGFSSLGGGTPIAIFQYDHGASSYQQSIVQQTSGGSYTPVKIATPLSPGSWYYIVGAWNGSTINAYLNGALANSVAATALYLDTAKTALGNAYGTTEYWPGVVDEFRLSVGLARPANVIQAEYNNQVAGSSFLTVGSEI